jgi:hypothetical protein
MCSHGLYFSCDMIAVTESEKNDDGYKTSRSWYALAHVAVVLAWSSVH